jgi:hypothetical protein
MEESRHVLHQNGAGTCLCGSCVWSVAYPRWVAVGTITKDDGKPLEPADKEFFQKRYFGISTPGREIDHGIYTVLFAIALGTLAEINFSIRKATEE